ncbi:HIT family protein [Anaerotruncus rubiinfantis]|uniref:HIT family protein n=1 Tax=Anaerotruncus rubiinfantis TaxID=1720200 RepID=UPI00083674ED|nr:HIT family protein [Anaerotruncus rubiinfantis]
MSQAACPYCKKDESLEKFAIEITQMRVSTLYLFKEQSHKGRIVVAYNGHVGDLTELNESERNDFFADVAQASTAIQKAFAPDKVNYGAYGDTMHHLHFHLVPKYQNEYEWGGCFEGNPGLVYLSESKYHDLIKTLLLYL